MIRMLKTFFPFLPLFSYVETLGSEDIVFFCQTALISRVKFTFVMMLSDEIIPIVSTVCLSKVLNFIEFVSLRSPHSVAPFSIIIHEVPFSSLKPLSAHHLVFILFIQTTTTTVRWHHHETTTLPKLHFYTSFKDFKVRFTNFLFHKEHHQGLLLMILLLLVSLALIILLRMFSRYPHF